MNETVLMTSADRAATPAEKRGAEKSAWAETVEIIKTVVYALLIALVLRVLLFQPYTIPSASMEPNLLEHDYIIVSKFSYGYSRHSIPFSPPLFKGRLFGRTPTRGDIIVFKLPRDGHTDYIKRLIGMPGDRIQVRHGQVVINDKPVPKQLVSTDTEILPPYGQPGPVKHYRETLPEGRSFVTNDFPDESDGDNTGVYVVPQGCFFMMGDNRDNSADSRFDPSFVTGAPSCAWNSALDDQAQGPGVGFVPAENLVGKAQLILLSWHDGASLFKPWTWFTKARPSRFFKILH